MFWNKCFICGERKNLEKMFFWGFECYYDLYYHDECLINVMDDPEKHSNEIIEYTIDILNRYSTSSRNRRNTIRKIKEMTC